MPKEAFLRELTARMASQGWAGAQSRRIAREVADHWEELEREGREHGLDEVAVREFAAQKVGEPTALLDCYAQTMRQASWAGRHPILCFVALPPLALMIWFLSWIGMAAGAGDVYGKLLGRNTHVWESYVVVLLGVKVIHYTGVFAVPALFWWWARRNLQGFNWRWLACGICAVHGLVNHVKVGQHSLHWAYGLASVDWLTVLAPLLVAAVAHWCERPRPMKGLIALAVASLVLTGCASSKMPQQRGWIGGEYKPASRLKGNDAKGLLITALSTNTPAARSGLREGDVILRVAGKDIRKLPPFQKVIDAAEPGSKLPMTVLRDGSTLDLEVRAGRETFTPSRALVLGILLSHEWDLWPDPDFSLIALGYKRQDRRLELDSPESRFKLSTREDESKGLRSSEGWEIWLPIISLSTRKRILSQAESD